MLTDWIGSIWTATESVILLPSAARAAERLTRAQAGRIWATATEFLAGEPRGQSTEARIDLALVDGIGRVRIIENVTLD